MTPKPIPQLLRIIIAIIAATSTTLALPITTMSTSLSCDHLKVVFARGSNEPVDGTNYRAFTKQLQTALLQHAPQLKTSYHELDYPAAGVSNFAEALVAKITAGEAFAFNDSVAAGQKALKNFIDRTTSNCPSTKFVLAGYSQGAMVISKSLPNLQANQILYVATFGDPKLYLPEGFGIDPAACHGRNLSNYRQTVPDCHTDAGILNALINYQPANFTNKLGAWCNAGDFMCGSYFDLFGGIMKGHTAYSNNGAYQEAAQVILARAKQQFSKLVDVPAVTRSGRDTAILIDNTYSMDSKFQRYQAEALRLATETIKQGGRIALYSYGDLADGTKPTQHCDFTTDLNVFKQGLNSITITDGGDSAESALSGLLHTMNTLTWHKGATKSIVLLTDDSYHSPDLDGTTLAQVVQRSLEIDPVNVFTITEPDKVDYYSELAYRTGGQSISFADANLVTDHLLVRPAIALDREFYSAPVGGELTFTAISSEPIVRYDWDLDGDSVFEITTTKPQVSHQYQYSINNFVQVRATTSTGHSSTASAALRVFSSTPATVSQLSATVNQQTAKLNFQTQHAQAALIMVEDSLLGYTKEQTFTITELTRPVVVKIIPIAASGRRGLAKSITVSPVGYIPTSPRTGVR